MVVATASRAEPVIIIARNSIKDSLTLCAGGLSNTVYGGLYKALRQPPSSLSTGQSLEAQALCSRMVRSAQPVNENPKNQFITRASWHPLNTEFVCRELSVMPGGDLVTRSASICDSLAAIPPIAQCLAEGSIDLRQPPPPLLMRAPVCCNHQRQVCAIRTAWGAIALYSVISEKHRCDRCSYAL